MVPDRNREDQYKMNAHYHVMQLLLLNQHGDTSPSFVPQWSANLQLQLQKNTAWHLWLRSPTLKCLLVIAWDSFCLCSAHPSMWQDNRVSHAVLFNRLAAENHSLKRNMGVYIAEAQRAKRILQHSRAAQGEDTAHDQHDVSSKYPPPPQLSQQHAQQACAEHVQLDCDYACGGTPGYSPSLQQQAQECRSPPHQCLSGITKMTDQPFDTANEDSSPGDLLDMMSQSKGCQAATPLPPAQSSGKSTDGTAMTDAGRPDNAAMVTPVPAAAEASFAVPNFTGSYHQLLSGAQLSQPHYTSGGNAARDSHAQTDLQINEQPCGHARPRHWYELHQEEEGGGTVLWQSGSCETAGHGTMCHHTAAVSDPVYRKEASPVAAKFAFARCASTEADTDNMCCQDDAPISQIMTGHTGSKLNRHVLHSEHQVFRLSACAAQCTVIYSSQHTTTTVHCLAQQYPAVCLCFCSFVCLSGCHIMFVQEFSRVLTCRQTGAEAGKTNTAGTRALAASVG